MLAHKNGKFSDSSYVGKFYKSIGKALCGRIVDSFEICVVSIKGSLANYITMSHIAWGKAQGVSPSTHYRDSV